MGDKNGVKEVTYVNTHLPTEDLNICLLLRTCVLTYPSLGRLYYQCQIIFLQGITPQRKQFSNYEQETCEICSILYATGSIHQV